MDFLNKAIFDSGSFAIKATYVTWIQYFETGRGKNTKCKDEAMLYFWLPYFVSPSDLEDGPNSFVIPLAILLASGKRLSLTPLYLVPCSRDWTSVLPMSLDQSDDMTS